MRNRPSLFYQTKILIARYVNIFVNDKQNLFLTIALPLLTILIVCLVACPKMYSVKPREDHSINGGYPVLSWEVVAQEKDEDGERKVIKASEVTESQWKGYDGYDLDVSVTAPSTTTKVDDEEYYLISDACQLAFLSNAAENSSAKKYLAYNYILQVDIDLKSKEWKPIGTESNPFTGTFDGNGHIIRNLKVDEDKDGAGLFGYIESDEENASTEEDETFYRNGIVKNLQIVDAEVKTTGKYAGIVAGHMNKTSAITSCSTKGGSVEAEDGYVGSVVGCVEGDTANVYVCYSTSKVISDAGYAGGLVGDLGSSRLSGCYSLAKINSTNGENVGVLVGNCSNIDEQLLNVYYDNSVVEDYDGIDGHNVKGKAQGLSTDALCNSASTITPFEKISTAYDISQGNPYEGEEKIYGFKRDSQLMVFASTQTGLFMLVCVAIFIGICNSIQEICKERNILKREYMTNLSLSAYVASKLIVQAVICAVQMLFVVLIFFLFVAGKRLPSSGAIFGGIGVEYFITMFLLAFAADAMSLLISSVVKNSSTANTFIPIILIIQIVFSGVLFDISGAMKFLSFFMISKWGISALAASSHLNDAQMIFMIDNPDFQLKLGSDMAASSIEGMYASTAGNLLLIWGVLLAFIVVCAVACRFVLVGVKNDKR